MRCCKLCLLLGGAAVLPALTNFVTPHSGQVASATVPTPAVQLRAQLQNARIIIKFADGVPAADSLFLQALSVQLGVSRSHERATSGRAHVYRVEGVSTLEELQRVLALLLPACPELIYAQEGRVARPA